MLCTCITLYSIQYTVELWILVVILSCLERLLLVQKVTLQFTAKSMRENSVVRVVSSFSIPLPISPSVHQVDTKWKERKEVLELLLPLAQSRKITPGDYGELIKALKKVNTS